MADSEQKRVSIFLADLRGGGAERSMLNVAIGLADRGHSVEFVLASAGGELLEQVPAHIPVVDLKVGRALGAVKPLRLYLRQRKPHALLSALEHANVVAVIANRLAGRPARTVVSIRNNLSADTSMQAGLRKRLEPLAAKVVYPSADAIVAVSRGTAADAEKVLGLAPGRVLPIYNPVVSKRMIARSHEDPGHPWLEPGQPPVILNVGRLNHQKDQANLMRAFAEACAGGEERLMILGEGELRSELSALAIELGIADRVQMPGFAQNPFAYMRRARLFVLSSRFEGLPGVLIQAIGSGCPAVSTDCPDGPNEILVDGKFGALVPVGDSKALAAAIREELARPRVSPPDEAWAPFEEQRTLDQYEAVLLGPR